MATTTSFANTDEFESCTLCSSKYNRNRPSFCQCKHCSIPLCLDCMKEHHDELLQEVAQISHQYNEMQQILQAKKTVIIEETKKSIERVNQYFENYITQLRETQHKIIEDVKQTKQKTEDQISQIESNLNKLGVEIQGLAKESVVQMVRMKCTTTELSKIKQELAVYEAVKVEDFINAQPDFASKLECLTAEMIKLQSKGLEIKETSQTSQNESLSETNVPKVCDPSFVPPAPVVNQSQDSDRDRDDNHLNRQRTCRRTTYSIDRMASDGENILYTSYFDKETDVIVYCLINADDKCRDVYRDWNQSRIVDMIWWNTITKFICATDDGIYTVDYDHGRFRIISVIRGSWSYIRVACNTDKLFVWMNSDNPNFNGMKIYSTEFKHIDTIDLANNTIGSFIDSSSSFCVTDNLIASICTRMQRNRKVFQVTFCDLNMNKLFSIPLGQYDDDIEIRTDGGNQFFITTGLDLFYVVHSDGLKRTINLEKAANCVAVLRNHRIAVSHHTRTLEIINY